MEVENRSPKVKPLPSPSELRETIPINLDAQAFIQGSRQAIRDILSQRDNRLLLIVGPCSIHDVEQAIEYATKLKRLADEVRNELVIVARMYVEKPRTSVGWKGFAHDPRLNGSGDMRHGLTESRSLYIKLAEMGLPVATEVLDPIVSHYLNDVVSWAALGARTVESQTHRELASGLRCPIGVKNGTSGSVDSAVDAMACIRHKHTRFSIGDDGRVAAYETAGNADTHVVLRGGHRATNFDIASIDDAWIQLLQRNLNSAVMIDCSHGNSQKQHEKQSIVLNQVLEQYERTPYKILGMMLESNLSEGNQRISHDLIPGVSVTDACIGWEETEQLVQRIALVYQRVHRPETQIHAARINLAAG